MIHELIRGAVKLTEAHDIGSLMKLTSEDFIADPGHYGNREVRAILFQAFSYYGQFKIVYPRPLVDMATSGKTAITTVYFLIVKKDLSFPGLDDLYHDPQSWLEKVGENADLYRLHLKLWKKEGDWLVREARLEPFAGW